MIEKVVENGYIHYRCRKCGFMTFSIIDAIRHAYMYHRCMLRDILHLVKELRKLVNDGCIKVSEIRHALPREIVQLIDKRL